MMNGNKEFMRYTNDQRICGLKTKIYEKRRKLLQKTIN